MKAVAMILLCAFSLSVTAAPPETLGKPEWTIDTRQTTKDGYVDLAWEMPAGEAVEVYRVTEVFDRTERSIFVDQPNVRPYRIAAGRYVYKIAACLKNRAGIPRCGRDSRKLFFTVPRSVQQSLLSEPPGTEVVSLPAPVAMASSSGGPGSLRPGGWYDPAKGGHG